MSKMQRISGNRMARYLQRKGFVVTRRKGSHMTLRKGSIFTQVPAGTKIMRIGTQHSILADVGIARKEFAEDYENGFMK